MNVPSVPPARRVVGDYQPAAGPQPAPAVATARRRCLCVPGLHLMRAGLFGQQQLKVCPLYSVCAVLNHLSLVPVPPGKFHRSLVLRVGQLKSFRASVWFPLNSCFTHGMTDLFCPGICEPFRMVLDMHGQRCRGCLWDLNSHLSYKAIFLSEFLWQSHLKCFIEKNF